MFDRHGPAQRGSLERVLHGRSSSFFLGESARDMRISRWGSTVATTVTVPTIDDKHLAVSLSRVSSEVTYSSAVRCTPTVTPSEVRHGSKPLLLWCAGCL